LKAKEERLKERLEERFEGVETKDEFNEHEKDKAVRELPIDNPKFMPDRD